MKTILLSLLVFSVACGTAEKDDTSSETTAEATSEPTSEPASSPTTDPGNDCTALSSQECFECFANEDIDGYTAYSTSVVTYCYCGVECGTDCADFCASEDGSVTPAAECDSCVTSVGNDQSSQCIQDFSAACNADSDCVAFANAVQTCPQ
jgi:hypothetical protein